MNIYDYAMEMERDGEKYYRDLAGKTANRGLRNILTMLADAEVIHCRLFGDMKENKEVAAVESTIIDQVKNIFQKLKEEDGAEGIDIAEVDLYRQAQALEEKTRDFYLAKAAEEEDEGRKRAFLEIAEEEKRHFRILENLVDFVSRPEQWLEDAEWYHLDEY